MSLSLPSPDGDLAPFHPPDLLRKALDEISVMEDGQHGSIKGLQGLFKLGPAGNVEVIDGLIQQKTIAFFGLPTAPASGGLAARNSAG